MSLIKSDAMQMMMNGFWKVLVLPPNTSQPVVQIWVKNTKNGRFVASLVQCIIICLC